MAEDEYNKKLESLQQYIPFLNNMIVQLRDPRKKNREQQLAKMVSLHSMITDKKKKLKLETLIKCEDVILKLHDKVKSGSQQSHLPPARAPPPPVISTGQQRYSPITPSSPSPPRDIPLTKPVVIPTEKVIDRDSTLCQPSSSSNISFKTKIDIYSSAADSLKSTTFPQPPAFVEKAPDMSKPPISLEDLEALQDDNVVDTEKMSLNELNDLRERIQKQLSTSEENSRQSINTTVRNTTILTKKAVEKGVPEMKPLEDKIKTPEPKPVESKVKTPEVKQSLKTTPPPSTPKSVKVIKEASSIFGNALSSIDNKLLQDANKKDKERRNSTGTKKEGEVSEKNKERRSSKDEKKPESSSHKSSKDKTDKKHSSEHSHRKDKKEDEKKAKDKKDEKKEKHDDKSKDDKSDKNKKDHKDDKERKKEGDKTKQKEDKDKTESADKPKSTETAPVYKRLADKYNPKPRKRPVESQIQAEVPKNVSESIENSMKTATPTIPLLDAPPNQLPSPIKPHVPLQTPINVPLLSPTSSTNSIDSEIANANRKPGSILPQLGLQNQLPHLPNLPNQIPTHVSNILANPNATAIINNVVNQFKGRQTPGLQPPAQNHFNPNFGNNFASNEMGSNVHFNNQASGNNYWGNQPQNHLPNQPQNHVSPQNFPQQRSFTPLPHQQMDFFNQNPPATPNAYSHQGPQGPPSTPNPYAHQGAQGPPSTPNPYGHQGRPSTPNPYGHQGLQSAPPTPNPYSQQPQGAAPNTFNRQGPPILSPQYENFEGRPPHRHERGGEDGLFGNKDRDMRNRDDWRRSWNSSRDNSRDPRLHRDPRSYRDDTRSYRRDSRENERESRPKFRDPRLNRYPSGSRYDRNERSERSQTPNRARSRSISRDSRDSDESNNTFASPLDSLYSSGDTYRKTGKGYGMQNFRIPKIKREETEPEKEVKSEHEIAAKPPELEPKTSEVKAPEPKELEAPESQETKTPEPQKTKSPEPEPETTTESPPKPVEAPKVEDNMAFSTSVSSSTECESKSAESEVSKEKGSADVSEISSTNDIQESESREDTKIQDQTEIINKFLKKLLENERTRAAASVFIENVSNSLDDEKLKEVVKTVKSATIEEEEQEEEEEEEEEEEVKAKPTRGKKKKIMTATKKKMWNKKMHWRRRRKLMALQALEDDNQDEQEEKDKEDISEKEQNDVVVTASERIKCRKRRIQPGKPKRKGKHKTELDLLHEDIQDMFIRDGVLTATGKRMCRLLKNEETNKPALPPIETRTRRSRVGAEKFDSKSQKNSDKLKAMSNVRVLIPKISVDSLEMDEDGQRYSLRRSNKVNKSYVEDESDEEKSKEKKEEIEEPVNEKEEEELEEEEESEPIEEGKPKQSSPKKIIHRKRNKSWASGVIPKRKKKEPILEEEEKTSDTESEKADRSLDLVEPDQNYFSSKPWHFKTPCKLCSFDSKNITKHYRFKHPESEVLSSRLSPTKAEDAITESLKLGLDESEDQILPSTRKFPFRCRFCDLDMNARPSNFYDHISTHTGEYRHLCSYCSFGACSDKPLKIHYMKVHGKEKDHRPVWIKTKVYGYICLECNYVQIQKKMVENHVNIYHLGEGKKIMKIYLSSIDHSLTPPPGLQKKVEGEDEEPSPETEGEEEEGEQIEPVIEQPEVKKKRIVRKKKLVQEKPPELEMHRSDEDEPSTKKTKLSEDIIPKQEQTDSFDEVTQKVPGKIPHTPIKREKEIDMTVFTCNTDIQEENEKIEQERLKKMTELNDSVKTNRQSLSFVEQLRNRLLQEEETPPPDMPVIIKTEPEDQVMEPRAEPELVLVPETIIPKKPSKVIESTASNSVEVIQKDNIKIQGMIQKLQGILKEEHTPPIEEPPPLTPLVEKQLDGVKTVLSAGFLNIIKDSDGLEYACKVPSCLFTSKDRETFLTHWTEDHTRVTLNYKMTKCRICQCDISATANKSLLINFFTHVEEKHLNDPRRNILSIRRLSGDKLSKTKETEEIAEEKEDFDIKVDDNPFGFKISGVMSLAEDSVPPLSPIAENKNPKIESVVLKESKMTAAEKISIWKCSEAMKKFMQCPRELYKCPQFFCKFATSFRHLFESHLKAHAALNDELVGCVYCDVKTPLSHAGLHIDLRHSSSLYSCSQCLYRALKREYVMVHLKLKHKETDLIISLPPKTAKTIMMTKQKRFGVKESCPPYRCGSKGCNAEFLYQNEYVHHLENKHDGMMMCGYKINKQAQCAFKCVVGDDIIDHWSSHSCYSFHCLICKAGAMELYTMLEHYATNHQSVDTLVVDRRTRPGNAPALYNDEACTKVRYVGDELLDSVNTQQYKIVGAEKPKPAPEVKTVAETPKNITLVPLSVIQSNSSSPEKKIIAIFPKKVDGVTNKLFSALTTKESTPPVAAQPFVFAAIPEDETSKDKNEPSKEDNQSRVDDTDTRNEVIGGDPLSLDPEVNSIVLASGDDSDSQDVGDIVGLKSYGLIGYQLYRCAYCDISFSNARDFKAHCMHSKQCRNVSSSIKPFKCVHCERLFKNPHGLLEHIQYHGQLRFCCSLCTQKFPSTFSLKLHMRNKHNVTSTVTTPLVPNKNNLERDEFVLRPVPVIESDGSKESPSLQAYSNEKSVFSPEEIDQLPKRYIFNSDVKCALCSYSTKVRTNLVRHLQFHSSEKSVPDIAPVNPVPCLDKNEKMFDKMTNLALSSFTGSNTSRMGGVKAEPKEKEQVQFPAYIPTHRRYVCCATGCNYLCLEEANLRHHLYALHVQEPSFTCVHCKSNLKTDIDGFLKHLKLHDLHLYKCSHCNFVHNLRHKVDKHCNDKHPEKIQRTITVRALEAESDLDQSQSVPAPPPETPAPSNIKWTKPWHCGMCKYRCAAKNDIVSHIFNKHDINTQYKCTLCSYKTNEKSTFEGHFKETHPCNDIDIIHVYYKSEGATQTSANQKQFDTTPLWQRDRPRVRHIRGILFEESTSPQKELKKVKPIGGGKASTSATPSTSTATSNLDLAIDAVAKGLDYTCQTTEVTDKEPDKELENVDVIIIDDDEEDENSPHEDKSGGEESELMIDVEGDSSEAKVKEEMPETPLLSEESLINKYGPLGTMGIKTFKCPICSKFRTKKISYFVYHLLTELKSYRFQCKSCEFGSVTFDAVVFHCQEEHNCAIASNVNDIHIEKTLEYWLHLVIQFQARAIVKANTPPAGEEAQTTTCRTQCDFCMRWFRNFYSLKEHELFHWAQHSYVCGHCCCEQVSLNEMFQHSFIAHPKFECSIKSKGPDLGRLISNLKTPPQVAPGNHQPQPSYSVEENIYACLQCGETDKSLDILQRHYIDSHKGNSDDFRYKVLTKTKVDVMYCCTYCHEKGTDEYLKRHHQENHFNLKFSIYQYICLECSGTYLNIKDLRSHFTKTHPGKKVTYSCVENKPSNSKDLFCCTKCPFRSCSVGGIRSHLRKHLRPIDCLLCGATFIYPTEARAHHNKEHLHNTEAVEENKERLKEYEDLIQEIVAAKERGERPSRPSPPKRMLARKSTGAPFVREYSFYGAKKDEVDMKSISTSIEVNNVTTRITVEQFSNIFNIFPVVDVEDCCQISGS